jgi:hypothetical protein
MNRISSKSTWIVMAAVLALALAVGTVAARSMFNDDAIPASDGDLAGGTRLGFTLNDARLNLAERLGISPDGIKLVSLTHAGWDGCLGVEVEDQVCTMQFIPGLIAIIEADGKDYRYHFGDDRFIATDFVEGTAVDGVPVDEDMQLNVDQLLDGAPDSWKKVSAR